MIEDKVQSGEPAHFIAKEEPPRQPNYNEDKIIDVILGGYSAGGASKKSKKAYVREVFRVDSKKPKKNPSPVISFSDDDYGERTIEDHQDALVITTKIGANTVQKILVDNGSSVDILYHSAFSRMNLRDESYVMQKMHHYMVSRVTKSKW